jgi:Suppressor of fused protein (SUFU)
LIEKVQRIINVDGSDEELARLAAEINDNVPHPDILDLIYDDKQTQTAAEIVDAALRHRPNAITLGASSADGEHQHGPAIVGKSKGGSRLLKYGGGEPKDPEVGFVDPSTAIEPEERERVYQELFGAFDFVVHEVIPFVPHVDVYQFPPTDARPFYTFVTGGMSDLPMNSPEELGPDFRRVELVFYAAENKPEYPELLRRLAHFPHDARTWIHWGHTMPNGTPPHPLLGTRLDHLFFMPSILQPDASLGERLAWRDEPVQLVWCVPITAAECELKLEKASDALYDLFEEHQHPFVFAGDRESYV